MRIITIQNLALTLLSLLFPILSFATSCDDAINRAIDRGQFPEDGNLTRETYSLIVSRRLTNFNSYQLYGADSFIALRIKETATSLVKLDSIKGDTKKSLREARDLLAEAKKIDTFGNSGGNSFVYLGMKNAIIEILSDRIATLLSIDNGFAKDGAMEAHYKRARKKLDFNTFGTDAINSYFSIYIRDTLDTYYAWSRDLN